jgi:hypothetical protein
VAAIGERSHRLTLTYAPPTRRPVAVTIPPGEMLGSRVSAGGRVLRRRSADGPTAREACPQSTANQTGVCDRSIAFVASGCEPRFGRSSPLWLRPCCDNQTLTSPLRVGSPGRVPVSPKRRAGPAPASRACSLRGPLDRHQAEPPLEHFAEGRLAPASLGFGVDVGEIDIDVLAQNGTRP